MRVVKIGGSLLDFAGLPAAWHAWHERQPPAVNLLMAGGGPFADAIRDAQAIHGIDDAAAHRLAIDSLGLSARLLGVLLPDVRIVSRPGEVAAAARQSRGLPTTLILDVAACFRESPADGPLNMLPASWQVTSDSLAAAVARLLEAGELVLAKSSLPTAPCDATRLAEIGFVDGYFPRAAAGLRVRMVNLRDPEQVDALVNFSDCNSPEPAGQTPCRDWRPLPSTGDCR